MLLKILKTNHATNLILFPLIAAAFWANDFLAPKEFVFLPFEDQMPLYSPVSRLLANQPLPQEIISLILLIFLAFTIQRLNSQFQFYSNRTLLPSSLFVFLVCGIPGLHTLHPVYFAAIFFVFVLIRVFKAYEGKSFYSNTFDSGLLLGLGSLFYFNTIFLFPFLAIGLRIVKREFRFRHIVLCFIGFILPWIFTFSVYFFIDKTGQLIEVLKENLLTCNNQVKENVPLLAFAGLLALVIFISGIFAISRFDEKKISIRKYYSVFLIFIVSLTAILAFSPFASVEVFVLLAVPSTFLISAFLLSIKRRFWAEFIFTVIAGAAILMQFAGLFFEH
jgi:hypothetical protein